MTELNIKMNIKQHGVGGERRVSLQARAGKPFLDSSQKTTIKGKKIIHFP